MCVCVCVCVCVWGWGGGGGGVVLLVSNLKKIVGNFQSIILAEQKYVVFLIQWTINPRPISS